MVVRCGKSSKPIILVLDFDGVVTKLDIDWEYVRARAPRVIGYKIGSLVEFFERNFGRRCFCVISKLVERYELRAVKRAEPYSDAVELLTSVKGIPIYITTMQSERAVEFFLRKHLLTQFIKDILGRNRFGSKRKQLEYLTMDAVPSNIVFIDDSWRNVLICKELGIKCIWLRREMGMSLTDTLTNIYRRFR